jgi:Flp pilus assembly protein TadG
MNLTRNARRMRGFLRDRGGTAAVEFALFSPVFFALMVGAVDLGGMIFARFSLDSAVQAGANYAQINASEVSAASGQTLATNVATIIQSSQGTDSANGSVVVNNGPSTTISGATLTPGTGSASPADSCYCPTAASGGGISSWGSAQTCGAACSGTGYAGKFVVITATSTYSPIFGGFGIVGGGTITATQVVQAQ